MYGTNTEYFGHIIETSNFNTSLIRPEMYEIKNNYVDWTSRYVHEKYLEYLNNNSKILEVSEILLYILITKILNSNFIFLSHVVTFFGSLWLPTNSVTILSQ